MNRIQLKGWVCYGAAPVLEGVLIYVSRKLHLLVRLNCGKPSPNIHPSGDDGHQRRLRTPLMSGCQAGHWDRATDSVYEDATFSSYGDS